MPRQGKRIRQLMDEEQFSRTLEEMAIRIFRMYSEPENLVMMGMATRGIPIAARICELLEAKYGQKISRGSLDTTFYRDDYHYRTSLANPKMQITEIPFSLEGKDIVLVDDVLYTGRTVRAALDALNDMGRARTIRLAVVVDRGHRQLPIAPDLTGILVETREKEEVRVNIQPQDEENSVWLVEVEESVRP